MQTVHYLRIAVLVVTLVFWLGVILYLGVSFALARSHSRKRLKRQALRAVFQEAFWVLLTQPLLPLYYLFGRRMGGGSAGVPVVLVHGYMQNRVDFIRIARALDASGSGPIYGFNYLWSNAVSASTARLATFVEEVRRAHGVEKVDIVAHSLGGVISLEYLRGAGAARVRRCVTIASPHAGVQWRGPVVGRSGSELRSDSEFFRRRAAEQVVAAKLTVPVLSIASTHDNVVHPLATSALGEAGGQDLLIDHLGHLTLLFAPKVIRAVVEFIATGALTKESAGAATDSHPVSLVASSAAGTALVTGVVAHGESTPHA